MRDAAKLCERRKRRREERLERCRSLWLERQAVPDQGRGPGEEGWGGEKGEEGGWYSRVVRVTVSVYLERSDSVLRRKAKKLSAPLEQAGDAETGEAQPEVRTR